MSEATGAIIALIFIICIFLGFFVIVGGLYVITSIIYKKVLEKDGRNGWLGFIPFYRDYLLMEMGDMNWYWILAMYAPTVVGIVVSVIPFVGTLATGALSIVALVAKVNVYYNLSKKFKTEDWFIVVLALVPPIGLGILGFSSKYQYHKEVEVQPDGFFGDLGFIKKEETGNTNTTAVANPKVEKKETSKVSEEEIKETKKEEVKEATTEEKPKNSKPKNTKKNTKKED
jgi:hypothetical protein